jgi:DNA processing protein
MSELGQLSDDERLDWLRLSLSENVGPITFQQLISRFGTAAKAIEALPELSQRGGMRRGLKLYDAERASVDLARGRKFGARAIAICENDYPSLLREIPSAPPIIWVMGKSEIASRPALGIVGARNASAIGLRFTRNLAGQLAEAGFAIVSGLARGIDTAAHEATLQTGTIGVVAGGIDHFYPPENEKLQRAIAEHGLLICENPPGSIPKAEHFPRRNRIISGLASGTIIIEAAMRSGSLITARFANEQGREVFAVPGSPLDPRCEGTNRLIKDGAHMLTNIQDVLEHVRGGRISQQQNLWETPAIKIASATPALRERVISLLSPTPVDVDDIIRESGGPAQQVLGVVLELELSGQLVRQTGGRVSLTVGEMK